MLVTAVLRASAFGLLAARSEFLRRRHTSSVQDRESVVAPWPTSSRKATARQAVVTSLVAEKIPLFATVRSFVRCDFAGTALQRRSNRPVAIHVATEQCGCQLCCLHSGKCSGPRDWRLSILTPTTSCRSGRFFWQLHFSSQSACSQSIGGKERPHIFTGWFWYVGMLVPVIGMTYRPASKRARIDTLTCHRSVCACSLRGITDLMALIMTSNLGSRRVATGLGPVKRGPRRVRTDGRRFRWLQAILHCHRSSDHHCVELACVCADVVLGEQ